MAEPFIQIGNLQFEGIKSSLISYLDKQDIIKDYDLSGSAAQVLIDILAYNTLYQSFYMNMVANESFLDTAQRLESIISLVKPLGYVVPGKTSAVAIAKVRQIGIDTPVPQYHRFTGNNGQGISFNFYTIQSYIADNDGEAEVEIYEGKQLVQGLPVTIDLDTQKGFLANTDIDLRTLTVEVLKNGKEEYETWAFSSNINTNITDETQVYFLERSELGYFLVFGGRSSTGSNDQVGARIDDGDLVRVSYLVSSGAAGNRVGNFDTEIAGQGDVTTETIFLSSDGTDEPDIESIKFFAPKWFAAQGRAVTANDAKALLAEKFSLSPQDFNVFGGEKLDPPIYGRVFLTLSGSNALAEEINSLDMVQYLKEKCVVSILPEYIPSVDLVAVLAGTLNYDSSETNLTESQLQTQINEYFSNKYKPNSFDSSFSVSDFIVDVSKINSAFRPNPTQLFFSIEGAVVPGKSFYTVRQECIPGSLGMVNVETTLSTEPVNIEAYGSLDAQGNQRIRAYYYDDDTGVPVVVRSNAGHFNPAKGEFSLKFGINKSSTFAVYPASTGAVSTLELKLSVNIGDLTLNPI